MRIALFHNAPSGGAKRAIYEWTKRLVERHRVDVFTLSTADHDFCDIRPYVQQHFVFDFSQRSLFKSPLGRLNQYRRWQDLGDLARLEEQIAGQVNAGAYDVVFAHTCRFGVIPTLLSHVTKPSVYYLHEPFGRTFVRQIQRPYVTAQPWKVQLNRMDPLIGLYNQRLDAMQRQSLGKTTRLLANSRFTQEQMKLAYGLDSKLCYLGVDVEQFRPVPSQPKENLVLSVGELSPRKGFDFIVAGLGRISADQRPQLRIVSNSYVPAERDYIEALARDNQVQVEILVGLDTERLMAQYNQARFCVYAPVLEPFGLVPLEAMACGVPVVGVAEGGVAETVVHEVTGLLVQRNPDEFADAVLRLLRDPQEIARYGANARAYVLDCWTWEQAVARLEDHLEKVK